MPTIRKLPAGLVNKIAAGEVIERPASVVKELLENCVDAGATRIELAIEGGGIELIRISDNGCGIAEDQIQLAVASHATSKLESSDDLFDVRTLGFRGEALASISEVSRITLRTRTAESDSGAEVQVQGGDRAPLEPVGCPVGTTIDVRHLFFNTPVRRKFMRTPQTEAGHITEAFTRIALAYPGISMKMTSGARSVYDLETSDSWKDRIRAFFGDEVADSLLAVESVQDDARLRGYVADPSVSRSNNRMQYLFLNGRHIRDRSLQHALGEAYRGLLMVGRFPICFLRLELPPAQVDVNVHPTKMEVRFQDSGKLYSQLLRTLRHEFLTTDLTARARHVPGPLPAGLEPAKSDSEAANAGTADELSQKSTGSSLAAELRHPTAGDSRWQNHENQMTHVPGVPGLDLTESVPEFKPFPDNQALRAQPNDSSQAGPQATQNSTDQSGFSGTLANDQADNQNSGQFPETFDSDVAEGGHVSRRFDQPHADSVQQQRSHLGYQVHNRYLVTQDDNGMVLVDQHALHERILYEQLKQKADSRTLESQKLLVPEPIDLTPAEAAAALESKEILATIGIGIEAFGGDTILMTSYPAMLANMRPAEVLRQVLEPLMSGGHEPSTRDVLDDLLHMIACKAAIKAGDKLSSEEITALLEQRYHYQDTHHCPHGRPTALFFTRQQLDKMFGRT